MGHEPHSLPESTNPAARALLVAVRFTRRDHARKSGTRLEELARLARTAGWEPVAEARQTRPHPHPATCVGAGKVDELARLVADRELGVVLFDCELGYAVRRRLGEALGVPVLDRAGLILEIFARNARTEEGRLQVEAARLRQELHRLLAEKKDLDRQRGGIGVRGGPGESAPGLARRRIHQKLARLEKQLAVCATRRDATRARRRQADLPRVALAGYTNAGKSTLLNALVGTEVAVARDQLFTTLTTTTRRVALPGGGPGLFSDTVGFVEQLPHHLVAAFRSTLEEAVDADLTLLVLAGDPATLVRHREVVEATLRDLGGDPDRWLPVVSKLDLLDAAGREAVAELAPDAPGISARTGEGLPALLRAVERRTRR